MPLPQDVRNAIENDHSQAIPPAATISVPMASPTHWLPHNLSPSRGPVSQEQLSRDGADSGIDVINVQETPLLIHSAPGEYSDVRPIQTQDQLRRAKQTPGLQDSAYYPHYPDINYMRWGSSQLGRRAADPRETDRFIRLATASARQRARNEKLGSMLSDGTLRMPGKLVTWHVATESRPPLRIDMSGPTPTTYSPRNKPLYETNAPAFSFGRKDPEIKGSGRRAWAKLWFRSHSPFTHKTNYELNWPTPPHYEQKSTLGPKQTSKPEFPSHSIGVRQNLQVVASLKPDIPASNQYEPDLAKRVVMTRAPAYTMGSKLPAKYWVNTPNVPAPNAYNPRLAIRAIKPTRPAYTMCGQRRIKRHDVGPFCTL